MKAANSANASARSREQNNEEQNNQEVEVLAHPPYVDYAIHDDTNVWSSFDRSTFFSENFPKTLHKALENADHYGYSNIISWRPHGRSFCIHHKELFVKKIIPVFFPSQGQYASFHRQLNSYGFLRLTKKGPDQKSFYHPLFLRSRPVLACLIVRSKQTENRVRRTIDPDTEPDLSQYPPLSPVSIIGDHGLHQDHLSPKPNVPITHDTAGEAAGTDLQMEADVQNLAFHNDVRTNPEQNHNAGPNFQHVPSTHSNDMSLGLEFLSLGRNNRFCSETVNSSVGRLDDILNSSQMENVFNFNAEDEESDCSLMSLSTNYDDFVPFLEDVDF